MTFFPAQLPCISMLSLLTLLLFAVHGANGKRLRSQHRQRLWVSLTFSLLRLFSLCVSLFVVVYKSPAAMAVININRHYLFMWPAGTLGLTSIWWCINFSRCDTIANIRTNCPGVATNWRGGGGGREGNRILVWVNVACTFGLGISLIGQGFMKLANSNDASPGSVAPFGCGWCCCCFLA